MHGAGQWLAHSLSPALAEQEALGRCIPRGSSRASEATPPPPTAVNYCAVGYQARHLNGRSEPLKPRRKQMMYYLPDTFLSKR